jgi:hypothetical protein
MTKEKSATTLRLSEERLKHIRAIAGYENRTLSTIFEEMAGEYIERHSETLALLGIPGFVQECREGLAEIKSGKGKFLIELDNQGLFESRKLYSKARPKAKKKN